MARYRSSPISAIRRHMSKTRAAAVLVLAGLVFVPTIALAGGAVYYSPCTHVVGNSSSGYTLNAVTAEYLDDCDALDAYQMKYVNMSGTIITTTDSSVGLSSDSFSRTGLVMYWTKHRAKDGAWGPTWTLYP